MIDDDLMEGDIENLVDEPVACETIEPPTTVARQLALRAFDSVERLSNVLAYQLEAHPKRSRALLGCALALMFFVSLRHGVIAQTPPTNNPNAMLQDEIDTAYNMTSTFHVFNNAIALAQLIFATLATMTVLVRGLAYYIRNQSVKGLGQVVLSSVLSLGVPFVIIAAAPTVLPLIAYTGIQIADIITDNPSSNVGNVTLDANNDPPAPQDITQALSQVYSETFGLQAGVNGNVAVTPSNIAKLGENIGFNIIDRAITAENTANANAKTQPDNPQTTYTDNNLNNIIIYLGISIIGVFVFIAVELIIAYLQLYLVMPVAAFSLGFLGSPATRQYGNGYWTVVVNALLKFVTVIFTIGFAVTLANIYTSYLSSQPPPTAIQTGNQVNSTALTTAIDYAMVSFTLLYIVKALPALFGGVLSGYAGSAEGSTSQAEGIAGNISSGRGGGGGGLLGGRGGSGAGGLTTGRIRTPNSTVGPRT